MPDASAIRELLLRRQLLLQNRAAAVIPFDDELASIEQALITATQFDDAAEEAMRASSCGARGIGESLMAMIARNGTLDYGVCALALFQVDNPSIKSLGIEVEAILGLLRDGWTVDRVLTRFPGLLAEDVSACLDYAVALLERARFHAEIRRRLADDEAHPDLAVPLEEVERRFLGKPLDETGE